MRTFLVRIGVLVLVATGFCLVSGTAFADPEKVTPKPKGWKPPPTNPCDGQDPGDCARWEAKAQADYMFPLAPGTSWTDRHSRKQGSGPEAQTEQTRKVVKSTEVDGYWKVEFDSGQVLFVKAGGVYDRTCGRGGACNYQPLYLRPDKDQTSFDTMYGGDVKITVTAKRLAQPVTTPAGTFRNCHEFHFPISETGRRTVYCEGVGVVRESDGEGEQVELIRFQKGA